MALQLDYTIDPDATEEEAKEIKDFITAMNELLEEGKIRAEVDEDGEPRFYPVD